MIKNRLTLLTVTAIALIVGCNEDERLARMAQDSVQQRQSVELIPPKAIPSIRFGNYAGSLVVHGG